MFEMNISPGCMAVLFSAERVFRFWLRAGPEIRNNGPGVHPEINNGKVIRCQEITRSRDF